MKQLTAADLNVQLFGDQHLVIRRNIKFKPEVHFRMAGFRGLGDLQLFQLFAAALRHFGGRGTHQIARNVILQLGRFGHIGIVLLLLQCHGHFFLRQIGREIALVGDQRSLLHFPDTVAGRIQKIAVMADHQHSAPVFFQIAFQPFHGGKIQMVGRLVQNQYVRLLQQQLCQTKAGKLTARKHTHAFFVGGRAEIHTVQHLADLNIHIISIHGIHDGAHAAMLGQECFIGRISGKLLIQNVHFFHSLNGRGIHRAHFAVYIQCGV